MSTSVEVEHHCPCPHCGHTTCTVTLLDCFGDVSQTSRCERCGYVVVFDYGCSSLDDPSITANKCDGIIIVNDQFIPGSLAGARSLAVLRGHEQAPIVRCWYLEGLSGRIERVIGDTRGMENYSDTLRHATELFARIEIQLDLGAPHVP